MLFVAKSVFLNSFGINFTEVSWSGITNQGLQDWQQYALGMSFSLHVHILSECQVPLHGFTSLIPPVIDTRDHFVSFLWKWGLISLVATIFASLSHPPTRTRAHTFAHTCIPTKWRLFLRPTISNVLIDGGGRSCSHCVSQVLLVYLVFQIWHLCKFPPSPYSSLPSFCLCCPFNFFATPSHLLHFNFILSWCFVWEETVTGEMDD